MSSPTQVNATVSVSVTPTTTTTSTTTKRRFLGAARRKKTTSSVPFLSQQGTKQKFLTDGSFQHVQSTWSNGMQKQTKTTFSCLPTNDTTTLFDHDVKKGTLEDGSSNSQTETTNTEAEKPSVPITPVRRGANYRKELHLQNDNSKLPFRNSLGGSARKRFRHDFKSPMRTNEDSSPKLAEQPDMAKNIESLQQSLEEIQTEITSLRNEGFCEDELQTHIAKMHEYNELKDTGQMLLGKIAMIDGVTTKDLYERFGLELND